MFPGIRSADQGAHVAIANFGVGAKRGKLASGSGEPRVMQRERRGHGLDRWRGIFTDSVGIGTVDIDCCWRLKKVAASDHALTDVAAQRGMLHHKVAKHDVRLPSALKPATRRTCNLLAKIASGGFVVLRQADNISASDQ